MAQAWLQHRCLMDGVSASSAELSTLGCGSYLQIPTIGVLIDMLRDNLFPDRDAVERTVGGVRSSRHAFKSLSSNGHRLKCTSTN